MRVPVILLTGFLGSGKTTILNRLFRARPPERGRFAIVVNEFGDVGIDGDLLPDGATRQVELPGGCVCCALVGELEDALVELLDAQPNLGCILLETTGVADPLPISWTLADKRLAERVRLAAVVTVVDPLHHAEHRPQSPSVDAQVRYADVIVLSKLDLVDSVPPEIEPQLREQNDVAPVLAVAPDDVPGRLWAFLDDPDLVASPRPSAASSGEHGHDHDTHAREWQTVSVPVRGTADLEDLVNALEDLPRGVVRLKGIVSAVDGETGQTEPALFAVHRVGARVSTERLVGAPAATETRLVAIGRGLDSRALADAFGRAVLP